MSNNMISLKVARSTNRSDVRLVTISSTAGVREFITQLGQVFSSVSSHDLDFESGGHLYSIQYKCDDNNNITVASAADLAEMFRFARRTASQTVHIVFSSLVAFGNSESEKLLNKKVQGLKEDLHATSTTLNGQIVALQAALAEQEAAVAAKDAVVVQLQAQVEEVQKQLSVAAEGRAKDGEAWTEAKAKEVESVKMELQGQIESKDKQLATLTLAVAEAQAVCDAKTKEIAELQLVIAETQAQRDGLREELGEATRALNELRTANDVLRADNDGLRADNSGLQEICDSLRQQRSILEQEHTEALALAGKTGGDGEALAAEVRDLRSRLEEAVAKRAALQEDLAGQMANAQEAMTAMKRLQGELERVSRMVDERDGGERQQRELVAQLQEALAAKTREAEDQMALLAQDKAICEKTLQEEVRNLSMALEARTSVEQKLQGEIAALQQQMQQVQAQAQQQIEGVQQQMQQMQLQQQQQQVPQQDQQQQQQQQQQQEEIAAGLARIAQEQQLLQTEKLNLLREQAEVLRQREEIEQELLARQEQQGEWAAARSAFLGEQEQISQSMMEDRQQHVEMTERLRRLMKQVEEAKAELTSADEAALRARSQLESLDDQIRQRQEQLTRIPVPTAPAAAAAAGAGAGAGARAIISAPQGETVVDRVMNAVRSMGVFVDDDWIQFMLRKCDNNEAETIQAILDKEEEVANIAAFTNKTNRVLIRNMLKEKDADTVSNELLLQGGDEA